MRGQVHRLKGPRHLLKFKGRHSLRILLLKVVFGGVLEVVRVCAVMVKLAPKQILRRLYFLINGAIYITRTPFYQTINVNI